MEAVPRLPMIHFELKVSPESVQFGPHLKQYIASFYNEDPESYNTEIANLEALRSAATRPTNDVAGCQLLKKYYCQLHFLKSRFPMNEMQAAAVYFSWKDSYSNVSCRVPDIRFELMCVLYNIGALHTQLGAADTRNLPDGLKMACTHFQCAAWAFQSIKEIYHQMIQYLTSIEVIHFMQQVCLAQAQECILEKSMMDNRKATITAKVAVQVVDHYKRALSLLTSGEDDSSFSSIVGGRTAKDWSKYLSFKVSYHKCIALLFQGQQAEEQQKMGERVAFYQAACDQLDEARKLSSSLKQQKDLAEALAFTSDVVEGKRKAAKNENEFIYHEEVPDKHALQEVKGASLVKGIAFSVNDLEVSGPDIFARLVPMEAHEASSLYSEKKAQKLRQLGELVEVKDQALAEFMSSLQLDIFSQMRQATGLSQELVDRAAALSAKPTATKDLVAAMGKLSNSYHEVESMLNEIQELLNEEDQNEKEYQELMGKRPPSIIATDLAREASKYREAHTKANDSNQNLHRAMTTHVANLKILAQPLMELQKQIPAVELPNPHVDENCVREVENLIAKVEEMRNQRAMLWTQFREAVHKDDITSVLVTRQADQPLDQLFQQELEKHNELATLIEQNIAAQENILRAFVDAYARSTSTRRYLQDIVARRNTTVTALITSFDTYEDLQSKANKGIEFYNKLETNVSKLLQRIRSTSKVQQEEREQMLSKNSASVHPKKEDVAAPTSNTAPKLKDYLDTRKKQSARTFPDVNLQYYPQNIPETQPWPPAIRPTPLGSEVNDPFLNKAQEQDAKISYANMDRTLTDRLSNLRVGHQYSTYTPDTYPAPNYNYQPQSPNLPQATQSNVATNNKQAFTVTTDTYQPISSSTQNVQFPQSSQNLQYPQSSNPPSLYTTDSQYANYAGYAAQQLGGQAVQPNMLYSQNQAPPIGPVPSQHSYTYSTPFNNEYATSVRPDVSEINQTSTYSSPTVHTKSSNSSVNDYIMSNGQNYPIYATNQPAVIQHYEQQPQAVVSQHQQHLAAMSQYQQQQPTPLSQYQQQLQAVSQYQQQQQTGESQYQQQQQPAVVDQYQQQKQAGESQYQQQPQAVFHQQYQYYYNGSYPQTYSAYSSGDPSIPRQSFDTILPVPTKESNIDLLTGLDFTVSQAPLMPQQNTSLPESKPEVPKAFTAVPSTKEEVPPPKIEKVINRKPLNNADVKKIFEQEVDKFEKFVDVLTNKTLSGPTNLDLKWKEIVDKQDVDKKAISVARCYPMKNRYPDILPYDYSRVELVATKDDYINASHIKDVSYYGAPFIVTQAPLPSTSGDFWTMIKEHQVELIVCLLGENEIGGDIYWPTEKGRDMTTSGMVVSLVSSTTKPHWIERLISVSVPEKRDSRVLIHLQFTSWPGSLFPTDPEPFVAFLGEVMNLFLQQRSTTHPVVVHCSSGIGRSGLLCLLVAAILEVTNDAVSIPDLVALTVKLSAWRKNILRDREHLKFAYEALLSYMKQVLAQGRAKKILNEVGLKNVEDLAVVNVESKKEAADPLNSLDPFWASKKNL